MIHFSGNPTPPLAVSLRIILLVGYFTSLIIYTSYSATLVSEFAVARPAPLPFSNMRELTQLSNWNAMHIDDDFFEVTASVSIIKSKLKKRSRLEILVMKISSSSKDILVYNFSKIKFILKIFY